MKSRKRRREVPSAGRSKRIARADQPSPPSTGGGGGGRDPRVIQGAAARQPDPVAAEREAQSASPVAPPPSFLMLGQLQFPVPDSSPPATSPGTAPHSGLDPTPPGTAPHSGPSSRSGSPSRKCRTREKKSPPGNKEWRNSSPSSSSSSPSSFRTVTGRKSKEKKHRDVVALVRTYLEGDGSRLVDDMWEQNKFDLRIDFFALRRVNKEAAHKICNENSKEMRVALSDAAREAVFESFKKKDFALRFPDEHTMNISLLHNFKLMLVNVPVSISSLQSAIAKLRGIALRSLFNNHTFSRKVVEMKEALRLLLVSCFGHLLHAHRNKRSWNGQWLIGDWDWVDEEFFVFEVPPKVYDDPEEHFTACKADLHQFATEIVSKFAISGAYPAYLRHFFDELNTEVDSMSREDYFGSEVEGMSWANYSGWGWYMEFLENHPAMMTPEARIGLIEGWYICINDLGYERWTEFMSTICGVLNWFDLVRNKPKAEVDGIAWLTFWHKAKKPDEENSDPSTWIPQYTETWAQNHRFLRQLSFHAYRYTKFPGGTQSIKETDEPELHAAQLLPRFLPEFIKHLLRRNQMRREFHRYWKGYCKQR